MLDTRHRFGASSLALLDLAQDIGLRTLDGATRLFDLNAQLARAWVTGTTDRLKSSLDPLSALALLGAQRADQAADAARQLAEVVQGTLRRVAGDAQQAAHAALGDAQPTLRTGSAPAAENARQAADTNVEQFATDGAEQFATNDATQFAADEAERFPTDAAEQFAADDAARDAAGNAGPGVTPQQDVMPRAATAGPAGATPEPDMASAPPEASPEPDAAAAPSAAASAPDATAVPSAVSSTAEALSIPEPAPAPELPTPHLPASLAAQQPIAQAVHDAIEEQAAQPAALSEPAKPARSRSRGTRAPARRPSNAS